MLRSRSRWRAERSSKNGRDTSEKTTTQCRIRPICIVVALLVGLAVGLGAFGVSQELQPRRTTAIYDPPVLAGQFIPGYCSAGFYARHGDSIVLTTSVHCAVEGTVVHDPETGVLLGVIGANAQDATCPYPGHTCAASDMNYLVVAADRIPWGHLNVVDMGTAGYRVIAADTRPLSCADVAIGDPIEMDGRGVYRTGTVSEKGQNLFDPVQDASFFPCMIASSLSAGPGDSGGSILVRGIPAGVTSRSFNGALGFTPLAEGLSELGLTLCPTPDCGLVAPVGSAPAP